MSLNDQQIQLITKTAIDIFESEKRKQEKQKRDYRLHNIKLLLKHYRSLVLHCETLKIDLENINSMSIQELDIEEITVEAIESIKANKTKSLAMVAFITNKIAVYKKSCSTEEMKYFRVLEKMYLADTKYTVSTIAESENVDRTTVYRYIEKAIKDLSVIIFGIDAIEFLA